MRHTADARLRVAYSLSVAIIALAAIASAVGLFVPSVYRETAWVVPQNRGQDLVTLSALALGMSCWYFEHCASRSVRH